MEFHISHVIEKFVEIRNSRSNGSTESGIRCTDTDPTDTDTRKNSPRIPSRILDPLGSRILRIPTDPLDPRHRYGSNGYEHPEIFDTDPGSVGIADPTDPVRIHGSVEHTGDPTGSHCGIPGEILWDPRVRSCGIPSSSTVIPRPKLKIFEKFFRNLYNYIRMIVWHFTFQHLTHKIF